MPSNTLVVVGAGPGISHKTAEVFAQKGFESIALIARNKERLEKQAETLRKASSSTTVKIYTSDVGDDETLKKTFQQIEKDFGPPEVVLFNAARIEPSEIGKEPASSILKDFQIMNIGLYVTISWAKPLLEERAKDRKQAPYPCMFLSGGAVADTPIPPVFALSMQKAAQHNLMKTFDAVSGEKGVHVAVANIGGEVKDEDPVINAKNISQTYWGLYTEDKDSWRHKVDIGVK